MTFSGVLFIGNYKIIVQKIIKIEKKMLSDFFEKKKLLYNSYARITKKYFFLKIFQNFFFFSIICQKLIYSPELTRRDPIFLKLFFVEYFGIWVSYFLKLPEKSSFCVVDLTKFSKKIHLKVHFFALKLHNFNSITSQVSCNVQMLHPS